MVRLFAEQPDWLQILYSVVVGREIGGLVRGDRLEASIEDRLVGRVEKRLADIGKRRLCNAVVLLLKDKLDNVANSSSDGVWLEGELLCQIAATDGDLMDLLGGSERDEGKDDKGSSKHYV